MIQARIDASNSQGLTVLAQYYTDAANEFANNSQWLIDSANQQGSDRSAILKKAYIIGVAIKLTAEKEKLSRWWAGALPTTATAATYQQGYTTAQGQVLGLLQLAAKNLKAMDGNVNWWWGKVHDVMVAWFTAEFAKIDPQIAALGDTPAAKLTYQTIAADLNYISSVANTRGIKLDANQTTTAN